MQPSLVLELSVVIPCRNEAVHLADSVEAIVSSLAREVNVFEVILIDDGSTDSTWQVVEELSRKNPAVRGLRLSRNFGKEAALAAGLDEATGQGVLVMDADLQHPPSLFAAMIAAHREGFDVVEGIKSDRGRESLGYSLFSRMFYRLFSSLSGLDLQSASDFKLLSRRAVDAWKKLGERTVFFRGMSSWLGFSRVRIPFEVAPRVGGQSSWSTLALFKLAAKAMVGFSSKPLQLLLWMGLGFGLFAVVLGLQTLYQKFAGQAVDGFTTVILLQLFIGSATMLGLALVGIYLAQIFEEVKGRPRYLVDRRTLDQRTSDQGTSAQRGGERLVQVQTRLGADD